MIRCRKFINFFVCLFIFTVPSQSTSKSLKDGTSYSNNTMLSGPMSITNETENGAIRKSPEGKDNDAIRHEDNKLTRDAAMQKYRENNGNGNQHPKIGNDISTEIFSTSNDNGKINVQVTVLVGEALFSFIFCFRIFPFSN